MTTPARRSDAVQAFLLTLDRDELEYAREYGEHLSVGAAMPGEGAVTTQRAAEIRAVLRKEWDARVWASRSRRRAKGGG